MGEEKKIISTSDLSLSVISPFPTGQIGSLLSINRPCCVFVSLQAPRTTTPARCWCSATPSTAATAPCWLGSGSSRPRCWLTTLCWRWAASRRWAPTPASSTAGTPLSTRRCWATRASATSSVSRLCCFWFFLGGGRCLLGFLRLKPFSHIWRAICNFRHFFSFFFFFGKFWFCWHDPGFHTYDTILWKILILNMIFNTTQTKEIFMHLGPQIGHIQNKRLVIAIERKAVELYWGFAACSVLSASRSLLICVLFVPILTPANHLWCLRGQTSASR